MLKFYLRQTVPFTLADLQQILRVFYKNPKNLDLQVKTKLAKLSHSQYIVLSESMRSILFKSLEFFRNKYPNKNELIIGEYSFHSNLSSALQAGFKLKFAPINQQTFLIDETQLEKLITQKTLGIIITHTHGQVDNLSKIQAIIKKYKLLVFEDCAHVFPLQELVARRVTKNFSNIKYLSFGPGKFMTAFGGGALASNDKELSLYLEKNLEKNDQQLQNYLTLAKACIYTLITIPLFAYLIMKPILAMSYLCKKQKKERDHFDNSTHQGRSIKTMNSLQKKLLLLQSTSLINQLRKIIQRRKKNAKALATLMGQVNANFCFQFPINVDQPEKFIWQMWLQNIDVQKDYCTYLPSLIKNKKFSQKKANFFEKIVYLPTNQYLSNSKIKLLKV